MPPLTPLRTGAGAATATLVGVLAVFCPQASAATGGDAVDAAPHVVDGGKSLRVPIDASADQVAGTMMARQVADSFAGTWLGGLLQYAADNSAAAKPTCRATVTATDSNGATGTASEVVAEQGDAAPLTIANRTHGVRWGAGDVDHFTYKMTCTDMRNGSQLSNVTVDQDAIAG